MQSSTDSRRPSVETTSQASSYSSARQRPTLTTDVDAYRTNLEPGSFTTSPSTTTPEAISFYRQKTTPVFSTASSNHSSATLPGTFEKPPLRSASGSLLSSAGRSPSNLGSQASRLERASFRDLVAHFNNASSPEACTPTRQAMRSASDMTSSQSNRASIIPSPVDQKGSHRTRLHKSPPRRRKSSQDGMRLSSSFPVNAARGGPMGDRLSRSNSFQNTSPQIQQSPLFGEIINYPSDGSRPGLDVHRLKARRVSEGSMHSPGANIVHSRSQSTTELSQPLLGIPGSESDPSRPIIHKRSTSDFTSAVRPLNANQNFDSLRNILPPASLQILDNYKASQELPSPARLPSQQPLPRETTSTLNYNTASRRPATPPATLSSRTYQQNVDGGPRLKAQIRAPPPQKSPPLRSSRPRQQVSAVTSRFSQYRPGSPTRGGTSDVGQENIGMKPSPERRRIANLQNMDIATRRESIRKAIKQADADALRDVGNSRHGTRGAAQPGLDDRGSELGGINEMPERNDTLTQLSSAVYQRPKQRLKLNIQDVPKDSLGDDPQTGATDIEDGSPVSAAMPGTFPDTENVSYSRETAQPSTSAVPRLSVDAPGEDRPSKVLDSRTVLSQIMDMRKKSLSNPWPASASSFGSHPDGEEAGTIQIMLSETPGLEHPNSLWQLPEQRNGSVANGEDSDFVRPLQWGDRREDFLSPSMNTGHDSMRNGRLTLDSDAYSVINRVLEQYDDSGVVSPEMITEFQQHIRDTDPELMAQEPNHESTLVAKLALEELIKDHSFLRQTPNASYQGLIGKRTSQASDTATSIEGSTSEGPESPQVFTAQHQAWQEQDSKERSLGTTGMRQVGQTTLSRYSLSNNDTRAAAWGLSRDRDGDPRPPPPPKDSLLAQQIIPDGSSPTRHADRYSTMMSPSYGQDSPALPEIKDTGGGLGLALENPPSRTLDPAASLQSAFTKILPGEPMQPVATPERDTFEDHSAPLHRSSLVPSMRRSTSANRSSDPTDVTSNSSASRPISYRSPDQASRNPSQDRDRAVDEKIPSVSKEEKKLNMRRNIIKELIDTEYSYHQDVTIVEDIYMGTASTCTELTNDDIRVLFGNISQVAAFSRVLADSLKEATRSVYSKPRNSRWRVKRGDNTNRDSLATSNSSQADQQLGSDLERDQRTQVGLVFTKNMGQLEKIYTEYLRNHDSANERLQKLQKSEKVSLWLNECQNYAIDITDAWNLDSLLVKPTQRVLKYPLLLNSLMDNTPDEHPDYLALQLSVKEIMNASSRINESKRRADLLEQVVSHRGKKDNDKTLGLGKAFGRRTEKLKQQIGMSDAVEDPEYKKVTQNFGGQFFQLQVVRADIEKYKQEAQIFMRQYNRLVEAIEAMIDIAPSQCPEIESKWRKFAMTVRELTAIAFVDLEAAVQKHCIDPMNHLVKLLERPQTLMQKRKKRLVEYARYKAIRDRGDKPDKKTAEQGEQFLALNDTIKDELPKLYTLIARLVEACLKNYVDAQAQWHSTWQRKVSVVLEAQQIPNLMSEIEPAFKDDFQYPEAEMLALSICNGAFLAESANYLASTTTLSGTERESRSGASTTLIGSTRTASVGSEQSPHAQNLNLHNRASTSSTGPPPLPSPRTSQEVTARAMQLSNGFAHDNRFRSSSGSGQYRLQPSFASPTSAGQRNGSIPGNSGTFFISRSPAPTPPINAGTTSSRQYSVDSDATATSASRPISSSTPTYFTVAGSTQPVTFFQQSPHLSQQSPQPSPLAPTMPTRLSQQSSHQSQISRKPSNSMSSVFSSALPMSDSSNHGIARATSLDQGHRDSNDSKDPRVIFLAASLFEFNIDRARQEAGYPYLTYVPGEVFDVIGEKGELWLARNQDDPNGSVGWIWEKHFAKLAAADT
ncbi:MAG: hypothetical protein M1828_000083 [Chrysothrix sp. TS-e1954]|nr:MAG: hypothetical protein M1828_000083 [Chrysothrix sp. TS-e1954]